MLDAARGEERFDGKRPSEACFGSGIGTDWRADFVWLSQTLPSCVSCPADPGRRAVAALAASNGSPREALARLLGLLGLASPQFVAAVEPSLVPCIAVIPGRGLGIVRDRLKTGEWVIETARDSLRLSSFPRDTAFLTFALPERSDDPETARKVLYGIFFARKGWIAQLFVASALASFLLLGTSFYSMQVYDRVVASGGVPTLVVLTIGVLIAIGVEFLLKLARVSISHAALDRIEIDMAARVFAVMLGIRLDAFPARLGGLAAQLRGFEAIKAFLAARTMFLICELLFALFFLGVVYLLGGPVMALVPAVALCLAIVSGLLFKRRIHRHARRERVVARTRQGHLIETLRNIELVKACASGWRAQGAWNALSWNGVLEGGKTRSAGETAAAVGAAVQQVGYVGLVGTGAWLAVEQSAMTTGSIVACAILSGRIFAPVAKLPSLLVQWGHATEALAALETLFARRRDHGDGRRPVLISELRGRLELRDVAFSHEPGAPAVSLTGLTVSAGEKVAILGRAGAGKSTVLKMMAGLIKPQAGQVLVDGLDVFSIAAERRAELIGYLPQSPGLTHGTVRENLMMGLSRVNDDDLIAAAEKTSLTDVLAMRPQGFETMVHEGGAGFSGGQAQLIALTRLLLAAPRVWLLDEPTAALDGPGERRVLAALKRAIGEQDTLVLVTHKVPPLDLVNRVIVTDGRKILADGPRERIVLEPGSAPPPPSPGRDTTRRGSIKR